MSRVCLSSVDKATIAQMRGDVDPCRTVRWSNHFAVSSFLLLVAGAPLVWWLLFLDRVVNVQLR